MKRNGKGNSTTPAQSVWDLCRAVLDCDDSVRDAHDEEVKLGSCWPFKDCPTTIRLLPGHSSSALRALAFVAGHAAFVRFGLPALRTNAGAGRPTCPGAAHAAAPLSLSLPLSSTSTSAFSSSWIHGFFLLAFLK